MFGYNFMGIMFSDFIESFFESFFSGNELFILFQKSIGRPDERSTFYL